MTPTPATEITLQQHAEASEKRHNEILEDIAECRENLSALRTELENEPEPSPQSTAPELIACLTRLEVLESQQAEILRELRQSREILQSIRESPLASNRSTPHNSSEAPIVEVVTPPETPIGPNSPPPELPPENANGGRSVRMKKV